MDDNFTLTPIEINNFLWTSNILAVISLFFGLFSIYVIWRFSSPNMKSYKW